MNELLKIKEEALSKIEACVSLKDLNDLRVLYLGKKGPMQAAMKSMKDMEPSERAEFGKVSNSVKQEITQAIEEKKAYLEQVQLNEKLKEVSADTSHPSLDLDTLRAFNNKFSLKNNSLDSQDKKGRKKAKSAVTFSKENNFKAQNISSEINVIGMNVEEATFVIDKYLDDCAIAKLSPVRIVHGKGTGKLRDGIHQYLKKNPHVQSFRLGTFGEGEMGVTVVELK